MSAAALLVDPIPHRRRAEQSARFDLRGAEQIVDHFSQIVGEPIISRGAKSRLALA